MITYRNRHFSIMMRDVQKGCYIEVSGYNSACESK